jgi:hypothetical protein
MHQKGVGVNTECMNRKSAGIVLEPFLSTLDSRRFDTQLVGEEERSCAFHAWKVGIVHLVIVPTGCTDLFIQVVNKAPPRVCALF